MNHFAQAGFAVEDQDDFGRLVELALERGTRTELARGLSFHDLADESGAGLDVVLRDGAVDCVKPGFAGGRGAEVVAVRWQPHEECEWCALLWVDVLEDGEQAYPAVVEVADLPLVRDAIREGERYRASLTVFAHELPDPAAWPDLADRAAIPTGTFGGEPQAEMLVAGEVVAAGWRRNAIAGRDYAWARLASYAAEYDVLLPEVPEVGATVHAHGWLLADLDMPRQPDAAKRWWRRG